METFHAAWKEAGSLKPIVSSTKGQHGGRFISLTVKFADIDSRGKKIKDSNGNQTYLKMFLTSAYFPATKKKADFDEDGVQPHGKFIEEMEAIFNKAPDNAHIIMGGDINARIGIREGDDLVKVIGPYGVKGDNDRGKDVISLLNQYQMRVENAFFILDNYNTYYHKTGGNPQCMTYVQYCSFISTSETVAS